MKKYLALVMTVCLLLALAACSTATTEPAAESVAPSEAASQASAEAPAEQAAEVSAGEAAPSPASDGYKIAVVPKDSSNAWFVRMDEGVTKFAEDTASTLSQKGPRDRCRHAGAG